MTIRKKLIEVSIPLEAINVASAREKSIRHGHPSTLHLWWARRPLAACRAVLFAQLVDDPSSWPERFEHDQEKIDAERRRLHKVIEALVPWEASNDETILNAARWEIARSVAWGLGEEPPPKHDAKAILDYLQTKAPPVYDPFCGGGSIPLEAQRLGLRAYGSDLNPVAVLIGKALVEIPPKFAGRPPVNPVARASSPLFFEPRDHAGWRSRGYLPHFDSPDAVQHIVFRLADALPAAAMAAVEQSPPGERMAAAAAALRAGHGERLLANPLIAEIVERALLHFDGERYRLLAWCVLSTHVHVLVAQTEGRSLSSVAHSWKSFTANEANKALGRKGAFWAPEYYDRFMRNEAQLETTRGYIESNPVGAGLCASPGDWRFSSAWKGARLAQSSATVARASSPQEEMRAGSPRYKGAQGLAEDVRYYGQWMRDEAEKRIGHLYPKATLPDGSQATVIAWLWARTVRSPDPAAKGAMVPLVTSLMLLTQEGRKAWAEPVIDAAAQDGWRFDVRSGVLSKPDEDRLRTGTKAARATFACVLTGATIGGAYIDSEAQAGRLSTRLIAIVAESGRSRVYLSPDNEQTDSARLAVAHVTAHRDQMDVPLQECRGTFGSNAQGRRYCFNTFADYFTDRQLVALTTFSDIVADVRNEALVPMIAWPEGGPSSDMQRYEG